MKFVVNLRKFFKHHGRCTGKIRYGKLSTAEQACEEMANKGSEGLTPYQCFLCGGFHIGHDRWLRFSINKY